MQDSINQIVQGFLSGGRDKKAQAVQLYQETFDLDEIQSKAVCCGTIVPNWWLEFDRAPLELLEELFSPKRIRELESGAESTTRERKRYRTHRLSQVRDGDYDADEIPGFWIHQIMDLNGDDIFGLSTVTGYSFSFIGTQFHDLFSWVEDCIDYLKMRGVVRDLQHFRRVRRRPATLGWRTHTVIQESNLQLPFLFP